MDAMNNDHLNILRRALHRRRRWWVALAAVLAVAATAVSFVPSAASDSKPSFYESCVAPYAAYPAEKRAVFEDECHARAAVVESATPAQRSEDLAKLRSESTASWAAQASAEVSEPPLPEEPGIEANPQNPEGSNHFFLPTTCWTGEVNGRWYEVYAGAKRSPAGEEPLIQSELHVYEDPVQERASSTELPVLVGKYVPPAATKEALTVTSSEGDELAIKTEAGASLKFNVATRTFE